MRESLECSEALASGPDSEQHDDDTDVPKSATSQHRIPMFPSCTSTISLRYLLAFVGSALFIITLTIAVSIFLKNWFRSSSQPSTNSPSAIYFSDLLERIKTERRWMAQPNPNAFQRRELDEYDIEIRRAENYSATAAQPNPNAFQRRELDEYDIEIRRAENYSATAYQGVFERIYSSTFHARDNYQLITDMLNKFHIPPSVAQHFDAREHWPLCRSSIAKVYDQGECWNYWLFSTLSTIEDRICIASSGEEKMRLSMFHLLTCCQECGSCRGGNPEAVYIYWVKYGITTELCQPSHGLLSSIGANCGSPCPLSMVKKADRKLRLRIKPCDSECLNPEHRYLDIYDRTQTNVHYGDYVNLIQKTVISERRAKSWDRGEIVRRQLYIDDAKWLDLVKKELFLRGPLSMDILLYDDFFLYRAGIYEPLSKSYANELFRYHVKVIGWHMVDNETIFIALNNWGTSWGESGSFRFPARLALHGGRPRAYAPYAAPNQE
ncbi:Cathepsin B-like cysteine proteinase 6 [Toxocara canis]|uniref:Cathepsin B-like cysteine proteinase 6 n=1 Tax=Toxocara canis TaxID=6265 RepID=A0A0B2VPI4_TOXCA|nr:Cathepsin B-like cysteine proteinase 6 [Toxocara canis]